MDFFRKRERKELENDNIVLQIKASYNQFTKAEKKVADYVVANQEKVLYMSITDPVSYTHLDVYKRQSGNLLLGIAFQKAFL